MQACAFFFIPAILPGRHILNLYSRNVTRAQKSERSSAAPFTLACSCALKTLSVLLQILLVNRKYFLSNGSTLRAQKSKYSRCFSLPLFLFSYSFLYLFLLLLFSTSPVFHFFLASGPQRKEHRDQFPKRN